MPDDLVYPGPIPTHPGGEDVGEEPGSVGAGLLDRTQYSSVRPFGRNAEIQRLLLGMPLENGRPRLWPSLLLHIPRSHDLPFRLPDLDDLRRPKSDEDGCLVMDTHGARGKRGHLSAGRGVG